jgi:RHS repeat-associated protein
VVQLAGSNGAILWQYDYDAFGNEREILGQDPALDTNPWRYCGEYFDKETGTIYLRARYYSPRTSRMLSPDPKWNPGNMIYGSNPKTMNGRMVPSIHAIMQSSNLYVYCMNNPIFYVDPTGLDAADAYLYMKDNPMPVLNLFNPKSIQTFMTWMNGCSEAYKIPSLVTATQLTDMGFQNVNAQMTFELNLTLKIYGITSTKHISHFLAQCAYESGWGKNLTESDNAAGTYLKGKKYYPYYGAGYIQLTGEKNYQAFSDAMGDPRIMEGPDYVAANYAWRAAGWWWDNAGMNGRIDSGYTVDNVSGQVTAWNKNAKDNGSYTARRNNYNTIYGVLTR